MIAASHIKTTIEISDPLLLRARQAASEQGTTLRNLVERGLRQVLAAEHPAVSFRLRRVTFKGDGLQAEMRGASWERLREMAYQERGG